MPIPLKYSTEVQTAIEEGRAIVALESTIIAHGMPYPNNLETAKRVEETIRAEGATPATIAVLHGQICVGLEAQQLEFLATSEEVDKLSRRDLPYTISQKRHGATTVAATMIIAQMAGIKVFVTGGIGGVHHGVTESWDISADLNELGQTDVAVVSAGAKSILDIGKTLQVLETLGVPVIGYQTEDFPAFYTRSSGYPADFRIDTPAEIAAFLRTKWELNLKGGVVIGNPIEATHSLDADELQSTVNKALDKARELNVSGKEVTPFLLSTVKHLTHGQSLNSNIELVVSNAKLGAQIAQELVK
ncbi:MAG: pseudouridine-5'-phosphate glycosidase [Flavobacteriales bacterium]|nr:pseudouridine-5'-phosphate glycosidase [Flavobacteriales bacterium]